MNSDSFTTGQVAKFCKVSPITIIRWIDSGQIKAHHLPGRGDRRVEKRDLLTFMRANDFPIPLQLESDVRRVLVVDDDGAVTRTLSLALFNAGFEVEVAKDGFMAGQLLETFHPSVMTVDLRMPGLSGIDVIRRIRDKKRLDSLRILVVSGMPPEQLEEAVAAGADDKLAKPFDNDELVRRVCALAGIESPV